MAWLAVDENGTEGIYEVMPYRELLEYLSKGYWITDEEYSFVHIPKGSIKKLIGRELEWSDDCIELKEE